MKSRQSQRPFVAWLLAIMAMIFFGGCDREPGAGSRRVTVVLMMDSRMEPLRNMQWLLLDHLVKQKAGYELRWWDAGGDEKSQITQLTEALKLKPDVLMVFPVKSESIAAALKQARLAGTKVYVFADDMPEAACTSAIYCDERKLGLMAGEFIGQSIRQKLADEGQPEAMGRVVQLTAPEGNAISALRKDGFAEALSQHPGVVIVHQAPAGLMGEGVPDRIGEALQLQKNFDVVFAHDDLIASAAASALVKAGLRDNVLVMGVDGATGKGGGIQMVTGSEIDATVYHPPLVDFAWSLALRGLKEPGFKPAPRNELKPIILDLKKAIEWTRDGIPPSKPE